MKILIPVHGYTCLSGSEMYVYELSRVLSNRGHDVTIVAANCGGLLYQRSSNLGIRIVDWNNIDVRTENFDIIHCNQAHMTEWAVMNHPSTKKVVTIHGELPPEDPYIVSGNSIYKYICIRPSVEQKMLKLGVHNTEVIYNPFDFSRFNATDAQEKKYALYVGSIDHIRINSIMEFIGIAKHDNLEVLIIGHGAEQHSFSDVDNLRHITDQIWNIEDYVKKSAYTGGIMNPGRTTIEGWLCGKPGYMWDVDWNGIIMKRYFESPPYDLDKFNAEVVTDQIYNLYIEALSV